MPSIKRKRSAPESASRPARLPTPPSDDSEEDEFAPERTGPASGRSRREDEEDEEDEEEDMIDPDEDEAGNGVARWEPDELDGHEEDETDDEDEESGSGGEEVSSDDDEAPAEKQRLAKLQRDLEQIPLQTLLKANKKLRKQAVSALSSQPSKERALLEAKHRLAAMQRAKGRAVGVNLPDLPSEEESDEPPESGRAGTGAGTMGDLRAVRRERKEGRAAEEERQKAWEERKAMLKRADKHAPMAMTATRPVSRKREVVEPPKIARRDPRFSSLSASNTDANLSRASYAFLPGLLRDEMKMLRGALTAATKAERSAPAADRAQRAAEREHLEGELARVRSRVERTEREEREREALRRVKKAEREKRAEGKGEWHMKRADKKQLLLEAKFSALEERGGQRAVKKAIEKKQKKVAQKEKRSRPFAKGMGGEGVGGGGGGAGDGRRRV